MIEETKTRTRRTLAERKQAAQNELLRIESLEKGEVLRLVSDAHDTLKEALSLAAAKPHTAALQGAVNALAASIAALSK